jgi:hypothetical protein
MSYILVFLIIILFFILFRQKKEYLKSDISKLKICICMLYTPNIACYSKITEDINKLYAKKYNYSFKTFYKRLANDRAPQWDKILAILELMKENYDYILWIDSDAYFNDHSKKLNEIFDFEGNYNIHISSDKPYGIYNVNTGIMLIKNTIWSKKFLQRIWDCDDEDYLYKAYHEQTIFDNLYIDNEMDAKNNVKIYDSYIFNNNNPTSNSFIIHMMQSPEYVRIYYSINKLYDLHD